MGFWNSRIKYLTYNKLKYGLQVSFCMKNLFLVGMEINPIQYASNTSYVSLYSLMIKKNVFPRMDTMKCITDI